MTQGKNLSTQVIHPASLAKRMWQGAFIGLILIAVFLLTAGHADPNWPKLWRLRPLIIVPLAAAMGGAFYYMMDHLRCQGGWKQVLASLLSLAVFLVALWMGTVLGLDGTYWD